MAHNEGMKDLIQLINVLQDAASTGGMNLGQLDLPQIAVVGEQSAGKSSVLENFVGKDFLPRGSGIVTRRPLVLQLHHIASEEYAEFLHHPGKQYTDFIEVREEIQAETDRVTSKKGISNVPINLRIYSPNVLDLTLVDLPGITQVAVGNQPADIGVQITAMIKEYISHENTLILAVSPANQDIANSCALKLAKSVDPEGIRTIGVVTKLDLMDKGTDAREILENKTLPLSRGYVGLVNRSQADIDKSKDIHLAQKAEMNFFKSHEAYRHMADRMGTKYLQQILNEQLGEHIRDKMPIIRANLKKQYIEVGRELESMQAFAEEKTDEWKQGNIIRLMQDFSESFRNFIEGHSTKAESTQLNAGARLNHCIYGQIYRLLNQMTTPNEKELKILIQNEHGKRNALFVSELVLDVVVCHLLKNYSDPMNKSVELAAEIISSTIAELSKQFMLYPRLKETVQLLLADKVKNSEEETKKHLQIHLKAQSSFINTKHPEFQRIVDNSEIPTDFDPNGSFQGNGLTRRDSNSSLNSSAPGDGFDRSPNPERKNVTTVEIIQTGWITLFPKGLASPSKKLWFRLTSESFMWYANENIRHPFNKKKEKDPIGSVLLDNLQLVINSKAGQYVICKEGRSGFQEVERMIIAFGTSVEEEEWEEAFQRAGLEIMSTPTPNNEDSSAVTLEVPQANKPVTQKDRKEQSRIDNQGRRLLYEKVEKDPEVLDSYNKMVYMVYSYMKIVDRTVHDIVPKYIYLLLIDEVTKYTNKELLAELLEDENWREFLEVSPREMARRERLLALYRSTEEALEMINAMDVM